MSKSAYPTPEELKSFLHYDPETGSVTWLDRPDSCFANKGVAASWRRRNLGKEAGCISAGGYKAVKIRDINYRLHRLLYVMTFGAIPDGMVVDHVNGDVTDNRLCNLRILDHGENARNTRVRSSSVSGVSGVNWIKRSKRWRASVGYRGVQYNLGEYLNMQTAIDVVQRFRRERNFSARHGVKPT